jgi:hypothetical protein
MQNKNIFEKIIPVTDTSHICSEIITNYRLANDIKDNDFKHVYVVYGIQENHPVVFNLIFMTTFEEVPLVSFTYYLQQISTKSFYQLLYLVTYYGFFKEDVANLSLFKDNNKGTGAVASYLEPTNGKLLYHYQVEQLYSSITNSTVEEAIAFRKAINMKRPSAFEKAKYLLFPSGETLFDVLTQYRFRDFTLYPKIKEAIALHNYLNQ